MKVLILLFAWIATLDMSAQCIYYQKYMNQGDVEMKKGSKANFEAAINAYSTAMIHCPEKAEEVRTKILEVFKEIERLKKVVEKALGDLKREQDVTKILLNDTKEAKTVADLALTNLSIEQSKTKRLLSETEQAKAVADTSLRKAQNLINAFYFYDNKFALAFKNNKFYYIDASGINVERLGRWDKAEQFSISTGFAKVGEYVENEIIYYLLDTLGNSYPTINDKSFLPFSKKILPIALDLTERRGFPYNSVGVSLFSFPDVKILIVNVKIFPNLDKIIKKCRNLEWVDLSDNQIDKLPKSISTLKKLKYLDLRNNFFSQEEKERITKLLTNCKIEFGQFDSLASKAHLHVNYQASFKYYKEKVKRDEYTSDLDWYNLSYYSLFVNKPIEAITSSQKALELNSRAKNVEANLALGYLLNNQWDKANEIYLRWKGKKFPNDRHLCDGIFLKNIADLEQAGITHPDFQRAKYIFIQ